MCGNKKFPEIARLRGVAVTGPATVRSISDCLTQGIFINS